MDYGSTEGSGNPSSFLRIQNLLNNQLFRYGLEFSLASRE
ncbi:hypothetical protein SBF1_540003 [Candidatus Desulfosporosinus infrequens]|uniref:Uncharacterized protein n=1 Tax=Candidatus Desulfosporosinus infrequens TaxID=2043169 RepID=A0A2U3LIX1_9FIRM|nr:hypothetical protein SBF1_540003 [Candidatus Desulfosporosinus infrequens]